MSRNVRNGKIILVMLIMHVRENGIRDGDVLMTIQKYIELSSPAQLLFIYLKSWF